MTSLSARSRRTLLGVARASIESALSREGKAPEPDDPELQVEAGAFVTLRKRGSLRGCIGTFYARGPLHRTVFQMARAAAFEDPRFPPVTSEELPQIDVEISVLAPMKKIGGVEEVEVGRHGLCIVQGQQRGVLLPQVAVECQWDGNTFLAHTCAKAGLPPDAWQKGAEIYSFEAEVFGENG